MFDNESYIYLLINYYAILASEKMVYIWGTFFDKMKKYGELIQQY